MGHRFAKIQKTDEGTVGSHFMVYLQQFLDLCLWCLETNMIKTTILKTGGGIFYDGKDLTIDCFVFRPFFAQKSLKIVSKRGGR